MAATHITITSAGVHQRTPHHSPHRGEIIDSGTVLLGTVLSIAAALLTVVLATIGDVSRWSLVLSVAAVGFVASWVHSARSHRRRPAIVTISHR